MADPKKLNLKYTEGRIGAYRFTLSRPHVEFYDNHILLILWFAIISPDGNTLFDQPVSRAGGLQDTAENLTELAIYTIEPLEPSFDRDFEDYIEEMINKTLYGWLF